MSFQLPDIDEDILHELADTIVESLDEIEIALDNLTAKPDDEAVLNKLFRALHSVKGNFRMCLLQPFSDYVHGIEETFSEIREGRLQFTPLLKEACLIALDQLRTHLAQLQIDGEVDAEAMQAVAHQFLTIATTDAAEIEQHAHTLLQLLTGSDADALPVAIEIPECSGPDAAGINTDGLDDDLRYFQTLAFLTDARVPFWCGRTQRMIGIVSALLPYLDGDVDRKQLHTAIYVHDMGMAFVPDEILNTPGKLSLSQHAAIEKHPHVGYQLLQRLSGWEQAAQMVLQHHEHLDGSGYPQGLKGSAIHYGARIISVIDAFCSLTSRRPDREHRRSVLRALMEIAHHGGSQFDNEIVKALTAMSRDFYTRS